MSTGRLAKVCVLLATCLSARAALGQQGGSGRATRAALQLAVKAVNDFSFHGVGAVDALLALGRQERIPLAIESVDLPFASRPVSIDVKDATVGALLNIILAGSRGYRWAIRDGVVHVTNRLDPPAHGSLLDRTIPSFRIGRVWLTEADRELSTALAFAISPRSGGVAGDYPGFSLHHPVGPLTLRNQPVWAILDALIKFPPGGAWVAMVPPRYLGQWHGEMWKVFGYDPENFQYLSTTLRYSLRDYPVQAPGIMR
ncbi:MAG: hypothetical protein ACRD3T_11795 [Terriglobia bacterium]